MSEATGFQRPGGIVFVSHEKSDQGLAHEIRSHLEAGGFACWMAPDDITGPVPWPEQISGAIDRCAVMLVVVSAHANGSPHVSREVDLAVERGKPLLPVRVADIAPTGSLDYLLRLAQWIDLFPGTVADHASNLQTTVASMLSQRDATPPPRPTTPPTTPPATHRRRPLITRRALAIAAGVVGVVAVIGIAIALTRGDGTEVVTDETADQAPPDAPPDEQAIEEPDAVRDPVATPTTTEPPSTGKSNITRISVSTDGTEGNDHSVNPSMSSDGRYVAFDSLASNLVEGDNNGMRDVFIHDRETGETTRINEVVYGDRIEEANESSGDARISGNGRYVAFTSGANNLDPNYDSYPLGHSNIYIHDRQTGQNRIISFQPNGSQHPSGAMAPDISDDGSLIAYATGIELPPEGIAPVEGDYTTWVHDTTTGTTSQVAEFDMSAPHVHVSPPSVTPDGSLAVVSGREGGTFVFERETSSISELPSFPDVASLIPFPDGERFAFWSSAPLVPDDLNQLADAFVYDRSTGEVTMLMAEARPLSISSDGRFVAVIENEESGGPVLVLDTQDGGTGQLSGAPGGPINVELSGDGGFATFSTTAELVGGDSNGKQDVFVMDLKD